MSSRKREGYCPFDGFLSDEEALNEKKQQNTLMHRLDSYTICAAT